MDGAYLIFLTSFQHAHSMTFSDFMCLLDLLVMTTLKVPELTTLSSRVTMPSYVVQLT